MILQRMLSIKITIRELMQTADTYTDRHIDRLFHAIAIMVRTDYFETFFNSDFYPRIDKC